ncbi:hypothetical protein TA3x_005852 (plasmid) [Tundrisphaera sp. TA3]|uniref:hypothetical protein n=1 Tax=Tundrisphaera sp. TA3 TaxID=3435775 RepID=UPI003EBB460B
MSRPKYVTAPELAVMAGVHESTIRYWLMTRKIPRPTITVGQTSAWTPLQAARIVADRQAAKAARAAKSGAAPPA